MQKKEKGFTLIEILITVTILVIIAAVSIPFYLNFYYRQQLDSSSNEITQFIRKAQVESVAGKDNDSYGVHFGKFGEDDDSEPYYFDYYKNSENFIEDKALCQADADCFILAPFLTICDIDLDYGSTITFDKNTGNTNLPEGGWVQLGIGDTCEGTSISYGGGEEEEPCPGGICESYGVEVVVTKVMEGCPSYDEDGTGDFAQYRCKLNRSLVDTEDTPANQALYNTTDPFPESKFCCGNIADWDAANGGIDFGDCEPGNLVCANKIAVLEISGEWTEPDPKNHISVNGGPQYNDFKKPGHMDEKHYYKIYTTGEARHNGKWDTTAYRVEDNNNDGENRIIGVYSPFIIIEGLQIRVGGYHDDVGIWVAADETNIIIRDNIIRGQWSTSTNRYGVQFSGWGPATKNHIVSNNIFYEFRTGTGRCIEAGGPDNVIISNNTFHDCGTGIRANDNQTSIYNNLISNSFDNWSFYVDGAGYFKNAYNNVYDKVDSFLYNNGGNNRGPGTPGFDGTIEFVDDDNGGFRLTYDDNAARNFGKDLRYHPNIPINYDMVGYRRRNPSELGLRQNPFDIGALEFVNTNEFVCSIQESCPGAGTGTCTENYGTGCCCGSLADWEEIKGGIDYTTPGCSLGDLPCANTIATAQIEGTWSSGTNNNDVVIDGWETDADFYINIKAIGDARHSGVWDDNKYILEDATPSTDKAAIMIKENYVKIDGLQILTHDDNDYYGIKMNAPAGSDEEKGNEISNNIIKGYRNVGGNGSGISTLSEPYVPNGNKSNAMIWNNIMHDVNPGVALSGGQSEEGLKVYNNTIHNAHSGIWTEDPNLNIIKNNLINLAGWLSYAGTGGNQDFLEAYNNSTDNNETPTTDPANNDYLNKKEQIFTFKDEANSDFRLSPSDVGAREWGQDLSNDPYLVFDTDIEGDARDDGYYDIGADEYYNATAPEVVTCLIRENCPCASNTEDGCGAGQTGTGSCQVNQESGCCCGSLNAWDNYNACIEYGSCADGDLVCANKIAQAKIVGDWSGHVDNRNVSLGGINTNCGTSNFPCFVTGPKNYIDIYTTGDARHNGIYGDKTTAYRLEPSADGYAIGILNNFLKVTGLQIRNNPGSTNSVISHWNNKLYIPKLGFEISENIIKGNNDSSSYGINMPEGSDAKIWNNIIYGFNGGNNTGSIKLNGDGKVENNYIYNNTLASSYRGVDLGYTPTGNSTIINNLFTNNTSAYPTDPNAKFKVAYNNATDGSEDITAHAINYSDNRNSSNFNDFDFVDSAAGDYHLAEDAENDPGALNFGFNLAFNEFLAFYNDIDNQSRSGFWDIGADEQEGTEPPETGPDGCPLSTRDVTTITINQLGKVDRCPR